MSLTSDDCLLTTKLSVPAAIPSKAAAPVAATTAPQAAPGASKVTKLFSFISPDLVSGHRLRPCAIVQVCLYWV
jgi:hypothetical protein